jgi:general secretion pathway protein L
MLLDFVLWWARQVRALLPRRLLADIDRADALLVDAQQADAKSGQVGLTIRRRGRETDLGRFPLTGGSPPTALRRRPRRAILRLRPGVLLERLVALPLAAESNLERVLGYEIDRLTPFATANAVWQAAVVQRDRAQGRVTVRLSLVPRAELLPVLDMLARIGITPTCLEAAARDGSRRRIALAAASRRRAGLRPHAIVGGAVAALAVAVLVTPFVTQSLARASTERAISALAPRVARVEALRKRLADGAAGVDALATEQARTGDVLLVLAAVTRLLPDDTVLTEFLLRQGKLGISGQSPAAAQLIPALAADPTFRNPTFAAPVTRTPDGHSDRFVIHAELAP